MTPPKERAAGPSFDYEKSLSELSKQLSKRLAVMKGSTWSPTPKKKAALALGNVRRTRAANTLKQSI